MELDFNCIETSAQHFVFCDHQWHSFFSSLNLSNNAITLIKPVLGVNEPHVYLCHAQGWVFSGTFLNDHSCFSNCILAPFMLQIWEEPVSSSANVDWMTLIFHLAFWRRATVQWSPFSSNNHVSHVLAYLYTSYDSCWEKGGHCSVLALEACSHFLNTC